MLLFVGHILQSFQFALMLAILKWFTLLNVYGEM